MFAQRLSLGSGSNTFLAFFGLIAAVAVDRREALTAFWQMHGVLGVQRKSKIPMHLLAPAFTAQSESCLQKVNSFPHKGVFSR